MTLQCSPLVSPEGGVVGSRSPEAAQNPITLAQDSQTCLPDAKMAGPTGSGFFFLLPPSWKHGMTVLWEQLGVTLIIAEVAVIEK